MRLRETLRGKRILVSGGTTGIGRETVALLAREGPSIRVVMEAGHVARDRAGHENPARAPRAHFAQDLLEQIGGAGDIGVDHPAPLVHILFDEGATAPGIARRSAGRRQ